MSVRALAHLPRSAGRDADQRGRGRGSGRLSGRGRAAGRGRSRQRFLGRIPRAEVEALYASHDLFCFPSFREPAGGVLYEAMRHGLPVVTADRGGPAWIVDDACGLRLPVTDPAAFAADIAAALRRLAVRPSPSRGAWRGRARQGAAGGAVVGQRPIAWSISTRRYRHHPNARRLIRKDRRPVPRSPHRFAFCAVTSGALIRVYPRLRKPQSRPWSHTMFDRKPVPAPSFLPSRPAAATGYRFSA
jgi:hypothetical protein